MMARTKPSNLLWPHLLTCFQSGAHGLVALRRDHRRVAKVQAGEAEEQLQLQHAPAPPSEHPSPALFPFPSLLSLCLLSLCLLLLLLLLKLVGLAGEQRKDRGCVRVHWSATDGARGLAAGTREIILQAAVAKSLE
jgi:hypothetical protein